MLPVGVYDPVEPLDADVLSAHPKKSYPVLVGVGSVIALALPHCAYRDKADVCLNVAPGLHDVPVPLAAVFQLENVRVDDSDGVEHVPPFALNVTVYVFVGLRLLILDPYAIVPFDGIFATVPLLSFL